MSIIRFKPEIAAMVVIGQGQANGLPVSGYQREITNVFAQLAQHGVFLAGIEQAPLVQQIFQSLGVTPPSQQQTMPQFAQAPMQQQAPMRQQAPMQAQQQQPAPMRSQPLEMPGSIVLDQPPGLTQPDNRPARPQIID